MSGTLDDARALLATPLGRPGSGRLRYGAAMTLFNAGLIGAEMLEVYRICANLDAEDPAAVLASRGLSPSGIIATLAEAVDGYLATLPGPGVPEVRAGLGALRPFAPEVAAGPPNPVVTRHLGTALAALEATHPALSAAIAAAAPHLRWITYDAYPRAQIGDAFAMGHAYAYIADEDGPIRARDYSLDLFLIAPHVLYRDHAHAAPELYVPLTGPHGWRFGPGKDLTIKPAHEPVWNNPHDPHATKVGAVPFLAIVGWTRDVNEVAYVIPAEDWAELERA
ncbi:MAG: dimethylsulfonioproprionate lyase family protein [Gemmobacter sp.]